MTRIDLPASADGTAEGGANGLVALVIAVVEILVEVLEREAVRRMERGDLTDEEVERLGTQLATLETEIEQLAAREGVDDEVDRLRGRLDGLVESAIRRVDDSGVPQRQGAAGGDGR
ncbi:protein gvpK [Salinigranum rubrum]|uniref:Protein gvpK n=1 Tax=Salinigranum rubrum TaxID=755307 RepID=A0A2I8VMY4_9EURY|nr:gas vesicle protein K [Salinigranum rubrum]AUV82449.1 protein gvpK [Salinigranum rubrum]